MLQYNYDGFEIYEYSPTQNEKIEKALFFAHANGVPAQTYRALFEKMALQFNWLIVTYDMRGFGKTKAKAKLIKDNSSDWTWDLLIQDHIAVFQKVKEQKNKNISWLLGGHSLGAWLALLSANRLKIDDLILLDPAILPPKILWKWSFISFLKMKHLSPMGKRVKKRKIKFPSEEIALTEYKKSSFMQKWSDESIRDYIKGSFLEQENEIHLSHDPKWEAMMFEEYPALATIAFLKIPFQTRKKIRPLFFVGELSDTCYPNAEKWVKLFFPNLKWILIPEGKHMFPIEMPDLLIQIIQDHS
ncbi:alpha/beta fold hydrolase [Fluviispira multicolorata]|uniref:Alpha/beta fold hydrolase n=1 Tax=Fluviispira multicolorata TaxID=2654512 RepID=A0A833JE56_9BACT|nr:alpha/beta hydrolase [Fluviispira multicolorata]KAB8032218.1 alpha/beta fold hydrolase [Fluviispira multicolorata]